MRKLKKIIVLITLLLFISCSTAYAWDNTITMGGPQQGTYRSDYQSPLRGDYLWSTVTCKFNQPRNVGTNPHTGIDLRTNSNNLAFYSPTNGKVVQVVADSGTPEVNRYIRVQLDFNKDGTYDNLYVEFWHIKSASVSVNQVVTANTQLGLTGSDHLDFRFLSNVTYPEGTRLVKLPGYLYYVNSAGSYWNYSKDLDFIVYNGTSNNIASYTIYARSGDTVISIPLSDVKFYHKLTSSTTWNSSTGMSKNGHDFSINVKNLSPQYTTYTQVHILIRAARSGVSNVYAWYQPKFQNKSAEPDNTYNPWLITIYP